MHSWRLRTEAPASAVALDTASVKRIQWLFERVCRHGYGAESSLKCAVQAGASRMTAAGATRSAIRSAIEATVEARDPDAHADPSRTTFMTAESRVCSIRTRMAAWADAIAPDGPAGQS